nr:retrovirus-related Pol polyprotein from transposon TNT 1-94 [Tanacetum cinerariifolium]
MTITLMGVGNILDVTFVIALLMNPLTVTKEPLLATGNQGLLINDPMNPLKSGSTKEINLFQIYSKESGSKEVFRDNSSCDTEGYGSVNYNGITFTRVAYVNGLKHDSFSQLGDTNFRVLFTKTRGTIFNHNNEVLLIAPRRRDVYVIEMSSYNEESNTCFFAKASNSVNWLWHKRLSHLNFKNINKLAKQNLVAGLPSLTYSKDKPYSTYEKGKHHRASFKIKRSLSISKCLHILHMDLFGPVKPKTISHNKSVVISFSFGADNVVKEI